jgi:hypothetical protein
MKSLQHSVTNENKLQELIDILLSVKINNKMDILDINDIYSLSETNEAETNQSSISIENYNLELIEVKINKPCINCSRTSMYTDKINNYCWIHCQLLTE